jgi:preprotein translocase SecE subunit
VAIIRTTEKTKTILDEVASVTHAKEDKIQITKKKGFLASTIAELRLVQWPSFKYTLTWATIVVLFTLILIVFVGGVDKLFSGVFQYTTCTAKYYKGGGGSDYGQCARELGQSLITF